MPVAPSPNVQLYAVMDPSLSLEALALNDALSGCGVENVNDALGGLFGTVPPRPLAAKCTLTRLAESAYGYTAISSRFAVIA